MFEKDPSIYAPNRFVWEWYNWAVLVAFGVALLVLIWIFLDSQRKGKRSDLWKVLGVIGLIAIIPSLVLFFDQRLAVRLLAAAKNGVAILAWVGLGGGIGSLLALLGFSLGLGVKQSVCPQCGRPMDRGWDRCPYCGWPEAPAPAPAPPPTIPEPLPPQPEPFPLPPEPVYREVDLNARPPDTEIIRPAVPSQLAWLVHLSGARQSRTEALKEVTNVGRDASANDVVVDDTSVSRQHARIKLENGQFVLYDLASANGTFVNDVQTQKQVLQDGDQVRLGRAEFQFMQIKPQTK